MRQIDKVILHCSDTNSDPEIGVEKIEEWHKKRGFKEIGYHFVIKVDGQIEFGRAIEKVGAHCKMQNTNSIGICLVGGRIDNKPVLDGSWLTKQQIQSLLLLLLILSKSFDFKIYGHSDFNKDKTCPNFDVTNLKNIYHEKFSCTN